MPSDITPTIHVPDVRATANCANDIVQSLLLGNGRAVLIGESVFDVASPEPQAGTRVAVHMLN